MYVFCMTFGVIGYGTHWLCFWGSFNSVKLVITLQRMNVL